MKTCLYNSDPLISHFYIVKTGVYRGIHYFFLFLLKNIDCGYSLEPPHRGGSNEYSQSMYDCFFICKFSVFGGEIFYIFVSWVGRKTASSCDTQYECGNVRLPSITVASPPSGLWGCHNLGGRARRQSSTDRWLGDLAIVVWQTILSL